MEERISKLRENLAGYNVGGIIITSRYNRYYLSGFTGTNGYLIIGKEKKILITDSRYIEQAKKQCPDYEIVNQGKNIYEVLQDILQQINISELGFEENYITYRQYADCEKNIKGVKLVPVINSVEKIREIKDRQEIKKIKKAAQIADKTFEHILNYIKIGITEKEIALEIDYFMKKLGASELSFETIVASGTRSSMPHGVASSKIIEDGDTITIDFGCIYDGYCSDMTRTIFVGEPHQKMKDIYKIVLEAQEAALKVLKPGVPCKDVDQIARDIISKYGYGENFGHGLGHSVGLEIHEDPALSTKSERILEAGMVVTVEPGIYVEGIGGVRIEDLVLITENGYENLTSSSKEITVI
ncbi:MAG: M24 family metallopeptidase [Deltaproteobacteria bacterium]